MGRRLAVLLFGALMAALVLAIAGAAWAGPECPPEDPGCNPTPPECTIGCQPPPPPPSGSECTITGTQGL